VFAIRPDRAIHAGLRSASLSRGSRARGTSSRSAADAAAHLLDDAGEPAIGIRATVTLTLARMDVAD